MDSLHRSHNAPTPHPTMHHSATEICTDVHISITKCRIAGHPPNAPWDPQDGSIRQWGDTHSTYIIRCNEIQTFNRTRFVMSLSHIVPLAPGDALWRLELCQHWLEWRIHAKWYQFTIPTSVDFSSTVHFLSVRHYWDVNVFQRGVSRFRWNACFRK